MRCTVSASTPAVNKVNGVSVLSSCMHCAAWKPQQQQHIHNGIQCTCTGTGERKAERKEEIGKGKQQVTDSERRLLRIQVTTDLDVSSVRVVGDEREAERRIREEQQRQVL